MPETEGRTEPEALVVGEAQASPRGGGGRSPLWSKAPLVLRRYPAVLLAVVAASAILAVASVSAAGFRSSAGSAALERAAAGIPPSVAGISVVSFGPIDEATFGPSNDELTRRAAEVPGLGPPVATIVGSIGQLQGIGQVRVASRTGALENVQVVEPGGGEGVWIDDQTSAQLDLHPGDRATLGVGGGLFELRVAGVYRRLSFGPQMPPRIARFWRPLAPMLANAITDANPPPLLLTDAGTALAIGQGAGDSGQYRWELPLERRRLTLPAGARLASRIRALRAELDDPSTPLGIRFRFATHDSAFPGLVEEARATVDALSAPVGTVSLAGRLVALAAMAAVGVFLVSRRRVEFALLSARGMGRAALGLRTALETLLPVAVGTAAGILGGLWLVRALGPSPLLHRVSVRAGTSASLVSAAAAVVLLGVVAAIAVREEAERGRLRGGAARFQWEWILLALAAASFYEVRTRGDARTTDGVDVLLLLFPLLFVASGAGFGVRALRRLLPRLRSGRSEGGPALFLASRRLAGASRIGLLLVAAGAVGLGVLGYAGTLVSSLRATSAAKASVFVGGDVSVALPVNPTLPEEMPVPATRVKRITGATLRPSVRSVDLVAIDPGTFADAVRWDEAFADRPLAALLEPLRDAGSVRAIAVGTDLGTDVTLEIEGISVPAEAAGSALAFPGIQPGRGMVVVSAAALERSLRAAGSNIERLDGSDELWARGEPAAALRALTRAGVVAESVVTVDDVKGSRSFLSLAWTFDFLQALGVLAGAVALVGVVLYLQARQRAREVAYALARRMGLTRGAHRRAVALELGGMLAAALLLGFGLALAASVLVHGRLDPLPGIPPSPLLRLPAGLAAATLGSLAVAAWVGAWLVQRRADRARVSEVMRLAG